MKLDKEQKRILKAFWPTMLVLPLGYTFFMWVFGKIDSWKDALLCVGIGILLFLVIGGRGFLTKKRRQFLAGLPPLYDESLLISRPDE